MTSSLSAREARAPSGLPRAGDLLALPRVSLVLGGARSGKSAYAETLIADAARPNGLRPLYIATAEARDPEMRERIALHRERRGALWETVEESLHLAGALVGAAGRAVLVDCLTLWLTNHLLAGRDLAAERERLVATLRSLDGPVVLIANEVGLGIVPDNALARAFRDEAGLLNQAVARVAGRVVFMAAGLPLLMKDAGMKDENLRNDL
ncbi:MAG: bifunctional adenosylcobinamide kinase/adenosylcobinamide-phosphate guanylyltransferase [Alphaproteobacteria bacterium]